LRFLHLSDLHFGTEAGDIIKHLNEAIAALEPDLIVISGDFTQVANTEEFKKAQEFVEALPAPVFCVPGNHDIPRYDWYERFFNPYKKFKKFITADLYPIQTGDQFIMAGLNTARPILPHWNWAHGAISQRQLDHLGKFFQSEADKYRICVLHHPVHKAEKSPLKVKVFGAHAAMQKIHALKVDLILTGHVHHASITVVENTVFASASTAISRRLRAQDNGFNVIDFNSDFFEISHFVYNGNAFLNVGTHKHKKNR
jgi:3',5'-cyclic AMP phosphodiesterase CpdA